MMVVIIFCAFLLLPLLPVLIGYFAKPVSDEEQIPIQAGHAANRDATVPGEPGKGYSGWVKCSRVLYFLSVILALLAVFPVLGLAIMMMALVGHIVFLIVLLAYLLLLLAWLLHVDAALTRH